MNGKAAKKLRELYAGTEEGLTKQIKRNYNQLNQSEKRHLMEIAEVMRSNRIQSKQQ